MSTARLPFFCELCHKGYARISELETHESSYDHHHRKRAKDLRDAGKDPTRNDRSKEIAMSRLIADENKKSQARRGFKSAFAGSAQQNEPATMHDEKHNEKTMRSMHSADVLYDPHFPTEGWD